MSIPNQSHTRSSIIDLIVQNEFIADRDLTSIIRVNLNRAQTTDLIKTIKVSTQAHTFGFSRKKTAKFIVLSPFEPSQDRLIGIQRMLLGSSFKDKTPYALESIKKYLVYGQQDTQRTGQLDFSRAFTDGRSITLIVATDGSEVDLQVELDQRANTAVIASVVIGLAAIIILSSVLTRK